MKKKTRFDQSICPACEKSNTLVIKTGTETTWICTACGWVSESPATKQRRTA